MRLLELLKVCPLLREIPGDLVECPLNRSTERVGELRSLTPLRHRSQKCVVSRQPQLREACLPVANRANE